MWSWALVALLIGLAAIAVAGGARPRARGFLVVGIALLIAVTLEALIQASIVPVDRGAEFMGLAVILLAGWAVWRLPRSGRHRPR